MWQCRTAVSDQRLDKRDHIPYGWSMCEARIRVVDDGMHRTVPMPEPDQGSTLVLCIRRLLTDRDLRVDGPDGDQ